MAASNAIAKIAVEETNEMPSGLEVVNVSAKPRRVAGSAQHSAPKPVATRSAATKTKLSVVEAEPDFDEETLPKWAQAALENSRANTFLCSLDFTIVYANKRAFEILAFMEPNLHNYSSAWKHFRASDVVGTNLDFLFTDEPIEFRRAADPRNHPYIKQIKTGPCVCDVQVTGIRDESGALVGYAVDWERITDKLAQERRVNQLMAVLEHSTANTFLCDLDMKIVYANKKSFDILEFMEPNLHAHSSAWKFFRAKDVIGTSLDFLFTDETEHYRKAKDARNHPYQCIIKTGPCTCDVTIASTKDDRGEVTGYAIYWERITERVAAQQREAQMMAEAQERVKAGEYLAEKIAEMKGATIAMAQGDLTQTIKIEKEDAIGELGHAFNSMAASLQNMAEAANRISAGDLTVEVHPQSDKDVLGHAFNNMVASLQTMAEAADRIAAGDLTVQLQVQSEHDVLGRAFSAMVSNLSGLVSQAYSAADSIATASTEVATGTDDLAQRTEEQASSLEQTAASMEEMTSTVKQNADNARQANGLAMQARDVAEKGGIVVGQAVGAMEEINRASKRIADIISVIDEIAFQTNLLALNAAVEAARVGEQGRGFAVVAAEVRNLAGRSATAAKEIKTLVQDSVQKVQEGSALVNGSGKTLDEIVGAVKKVADIIAEISAASQEQTAGIEQVNKAIIQMDQITQQNAALVEQTAAASQAMTEQASQLQSVVGQFQLERGHLSASPAAPSMPPRGAAPRPAAGRATMGRPTALASRPAASAPRRMASMPTKRADDDFEEF